MIGIADRHKALDFDIAVMFIAERVEQGEAIDVEDAIRQRRAGIAALRAFQIRPTSMN